MLRTGFAIFSHTLKTLSVPSAPDLSMIRIFGAIAYTHIPTEHRKKLDDSSAVGMMVGYSRTSRALLVMSESPDGLPEVVESDSVRFNENELGCLHVCGQRASIIDDSVDSGFFSLGEQHTVAPPVLAPVVPVPVPLVEHAAAQLQPQPLQGNVADHVMNVAANQPAIDPQETPTDSGNQGISVLGGLHLPQDTTGDNELSSDSDVQDDGANQMQTSPDRPQRIWKKVVHFVPNVNSIQKLTDKPTYMEIWNLPDLPQWLEVKRSAYDSV
jgi:hypothetical protein